MSVGRQIIQNPVRILSQISARRSTVSCCTVLHGFKRLMPDGATFGIKHFKLQQPLTWCTIRTYATKKAKQKKDKVESHKGSKHHRVELTPDEYEDVIDLEKMKSQMQGALDHLKTEYVQSLSLRTSPGAFDHLIINTSEGKFPVNQLGQVAVKNPNFLIINMTTSPQYIPAVMESIKKSGMNVSPQQDGNTIAVPIPKVTREHRENLAKNAKVLCHKAKERIRECYSKQLKHVKKCDGKPAELIWNIEQMLLQVMHAYTAEADNLNKVKQQELLAE